MNSRETKVRNSQNEALSRAEVKAVAAVEKARAKARKEDPEVIRKRIFGL